MGMADSDNAGGSGNTGGRGGGSSGGSSGGGGTGGGRPGGFDGRDTPGAPGAADGKRGSSMGRDGGRAGGGTGGGKDGRGANTPGAPSNEGRRGTHAEGSTPASRARDAMARHSREARDREQRRGAGDTYSLAGSLKEAEEAGTMSPRQRDMAIGMEAGMESKGFMDSVGGMLSRGVNAVTDTIGLGKVADVAASAGVNAMAVPDNPASRYGAAVARNRMDNSMVQDAAEGLAGLFAGPGASAVVGAVNTGLNLNANKDIASLNADIDAREAAARPTRQPGMGGGTASSARDAMTARTSQPAPAAPARPAFEWSPVNMDNYRRGLITPYLN